MFQSLRNTRCSQVWTLPVRQRRGPALRRTQRDEHDSLPGLDGDSERNVVHTSNQLQQRVSRLPQSAASGEASFSLLTIRVNRSYIQ